MKHGTKGTWTLKEVHTLDTDSWKWTEHSDKVEGDPPSARVGYAAWDDEPGELSGLAGQPLLTPSLLIACTKLFGAISMFPVQVRSGNRARIWR